MQTFDRQGSLQTGFRYRAACVRLATVVFRAPSHVDGVTVRVEYHAGWAASLSLSSLLKLGELGTLNLLFDL